MTQIQYTRAEKIYMNLIHSPTFGKLNPGDLLVYLGFSGVVMRPSEFVDFEKKLAAKLKSNAPKIVKPTTKQIVDLNGAKK